MRISAPITGFRDARDVPVRLRRYPRRSHLIARVFWAALLHGAGGAGGSSPRCGRRGRRVLARRETAGTWRGTSLPPGTARHRTAQPASLAPSTRVYSRQATPISAAGSQWLGAALWTSDTNSAPRKCYLLPVSPPSLTPARLLHIARRTTAGRTLHLAPVLEAAPPSVRYGNARAGRLHRHVAAVEDGYDGYKQQQPVAAVVARAGGGGRRATETRQATVGGITW